MGKDAGHEQHDMAAPVRPRVCHGVPGVHTRQRKAVEPGELPQPCWRQASALGLCHGLLHRLDLPALVEAVGAEVLPHQGLAHHVAADLARRRRCEHGISMTTALRLGEYGCTEQQAAPEPLESKQAKGTA